MPILAPRCLGSPAIVVVASAAALNKEIVEHSLVLVCDVGDGGRRSNSAGYRVILRGASAENPPPERQRDDFNYAAPGDRLPNQPDGRKLSLIPAHPGISAITEEP
jgi:hypothetical protein